MIYYISHLYDFSDVCILNYLFICVWTFAELGYSQVIGINKKMCYPMCVCILCVLSYVCYPMCVYVRLIGYRSHIFPSIFARFSRMTSLDFCFWTRTPLHTPPMISARTEVPSGCRHTASAQWPLEPFILPLLLDLEHAGTTLHWQ